MRGLAEQRSIAAGEDRHVRRAAQFDRGQRILNRLREWDIAADDTDAGDTHIRRAQRHDQRNRVVAGSVGVDEEGASCPLSLWERAGVRG
jgi:hypothetical protein